MTDARHSDHTARRFLVLWSAASVLLLGAVALFVCVVDPYGLYRWVDKPGFNRVKPGLERLQFEIKLSHARRLQPELLILGNSRAEIGFDPQAPALQGRRAYNLAIPGTSLESSLKQWRQAQAFARPPRQVLVGVDFVDFVELRSAAARAVPGGTTAPPTQRFWPLEALFSVASVGDAMRTLRLQHAPLAATLTAEGFNPLQEYVALARDEGYHAIFRQKQGQFAARLTRASGRLNADDFAQLKALVTELAAAGVETKLVVYPYHAQFMALMDEAGLGPQFTNWKRQVLQLVAQLRQAYPQARLSLTDFSGYGMYQCEPVPPAGDRVSITQWYWEGGHFKKALGDLMLARLFGGAGEPGFGIELDPAAVAADEQRLRDEQAACRAAHPEFFSAARSTGVQSR